MALLKQIPVIFWARTGTALCKRNSENRDLKVVLELSDELTDEQADGGKGIFNK